MTEQLDTITVTGSGTADVTASHADILVRVAGSGSFGPDQATARAKEVVALVEALEAVGIAPDRVEVLGITTESGGGRLARSSAATYRLRVRTGTIAQVPLALDAVSGHKHAGIDGIVWRYPERTGRMEALQEAIAAAREAATTAAAALEVRLVQVHSFTERTFDDDLRPMPRMAMAAMADSSDAAPTLDIEVLHRKTIRVQVDLSYRIA
jgi:uncharacterized protein YggE